MNLARADDAPAPPPETPIYLAPDGWIPVKGKFYSATKSVAPPVDVRRAFGPEQKVATEVLKDGKPVYLIQPDGAVLHFEVTEKPGTPENPGPRLRVILARTTSVADPLDFTGCTAISYDIEIGLVLAETDWVKGNQTLFQYSPETIARINALLSTARAEN
jgi:hypothetical protein